MFDSQFEKNLQRVLPIIIVRSINLNSLELGLVAYTGSDATAMLFVFWENNHTLSCKLKDSQGEDEAKHAENKKTHEQGKQHYSIHVDLLKNATVAIKQEHHMNWRNFSVIVQVWGND